MPNHVAIQYLERKLYRFNYNKVRFPTFVQKSEKAVFTEDQSLSFSAIQSLSNLKLNPEILG